MRYLLAALFYAMVLNSTGEARYRAFVDNAHGKIRYAAQKINDNFMKFDVIQLGKEISKDGSAEYYLLIMFQGKRFESKVIGDKAQIVIDEAVYDMEKDLNAPHIENGAINKVAIAEFKLSQRGCKKTLKNQKGLEQVLYLFQALCCLHFF